MMKKYGSYNWEVWMEQLWGVDAATGGCGSSQKGCGFRGTLNFPWKLVYSEKQTISLIAVGYGGLNKGSGKCKR